MSSALRLHSLAMSGGLLDAIERSESDELDAAQRGFRWLRLDAAAVLIAAIRAKIDDGALDDDGRAEALDQRADAAYGEVVPVDQAIFDAFLGRFAEEPSAFTTA